MSKFPLYDSLSTDIKNKDLTATQKKSFLKKIDKIDHVGHETLYALIRMYQLENEKSSTLSLPYDGTHKGDNLVFDINELPQKLRHILYKFLGKHLDKMKEEKKISKNTPVKRM